jgi:hypothetical protein
MEGIMENSKFYGVNAFLQVKPCLTTNDSKPRELPEAELFKAEKGSWADYMKNNSIVQISLNEDGLEFVDSAQPKIGEALEVALIFPTIADHRWCAVTLYGNVNLIKGFKEELVIIGIKFLEMSQSAKREIAHFLDETRRQVEKIKQFETNYPQSAKMR